MSHKHISCKFNEEESFVHEWLKDFFGFKNQHGEDSQTIKQAEIVAFNVLRNFFGVQLADIFKRKSRDELIRIRTLQQERIKKSNTLRCKK